MSPIVRRTWSRQGHTPIFLQRGRAYQKVSMIAAVTTASRCMRTGLYFSLHVDRNIKAPQVLRFLRALTHQIRRPLVIIWDRSRSHKARAIERFIHSYPRVTVYFFPPYAPELNPAEYIWGYLKNNPLANRAITESQKLSQTARYYSTKIKKHHKLLRSFLYASSLFCHK
jgi:transposase